MWISYTAAINAFNSASEAGAKDIQAGLARAYLKRGEIVSTFDPSKLENIQSQLIQAYFKLGENIPNERNLSYLRCLARKDFEKAEQYGSDEATAILKDIQFRQAEVITSRYFTNELPLTSVEDAVVKQQHEIKNTRHLAYCWHSHTSDEQKETLCALALKILTAANNLTGSDNLGHSQEIAPLAAIPDKKIYDRWTNIMITALSGKGMLNQPALRGLEVILRNLPLSWLNAQQVEMSLVRLLETLNGIFKSNPWGSTESLQVLLQTTSQLLDTIFRVGIKFGISRKGLRDSLNKSLADLRGKYSTDPELTFQVDYARQALERIPNDESALKEAATRAYDALITALSIKAIIASVAKNGVAFHYAVENASKAGDIPNAVAALTSFNAADAKTALPILKEIGTNMRQALRNRTVARPWYTALQFIDVCFLEQGWLFEFESFFHEYLNVDDENFLQGLCQRLEYIVGRQYSEAQRLEKRAQFLENRTQLLAPLASEARDRAQQVKKVAQQATKFLSDFMLPKNNRVVQQATLNTLKRLKAELPELLEELPEILKQVRTADDGASVQKAEVTPAWHADWYTPPTELLKKQLGESAELTLGPKLQELRKAFLQTTEDIIIAKDNTIVAKDELYEKPDCTLINQNQRLALESKDDKIGEINSFLTSPEARVLLLLGGTGSGKTQFGRHLARRLWDEYSAAIEQDDYSRPIPLFIDLPKLNPNSSVSPGNFISTYLTNQGLEAQFKDLRKDERRFVFILDGYDEFASFSPTFYADNELGQWTHAKIIISSRREYLGTDNYRDSFLPPSTYESQRPSDQFLKEFHLAPFSDEMIERYIENYVTKSKQDASLIEQYKEKLLNGSPELKKLISNPLLLNMALTVFKTPESIDNTITRIGLYDKFMEYWFDRECKSLGNNPNLKERDFFIKNLFKNFSKRVKTSAQDFAIGIYKEKKETQGVVKYSTVKEPPSWCKNFLNPDDVKNSLLRRSIPLNHQIIQEEGLLETYQYEQYQFKHKSFLDYFVAEALWESCVLQATEMEPLFNQLNLVKDPGVLDFLAERVQQKPALIDLLVDLINLSKSDDKSGDEFHIAAANALTILVRAEVQLSGRDFNAIHARGADLSYGVFDHTKFERADLSEVQLRGAWLRKVNLAGADLAGVNFGEKPRLQPGVIVKACCYSPDGAWLAIATNNRVQLYCTETLELQPIVREHRGDTVVTSVAFSRNGQWLASGGTDCAVRLWSVKPDAKGSSSAFKFIGHEDWVLSVAFSPNNKWLASGSADHTVKLWSVEPDAEGFRLGFTFKGHTHSVKSVAFSSPKGKWLASGSYDKSIKLWSVKPDGVESEAFLPGDQRSASSSEDKPIKLKGIGEDTFEGYHNEENERYRYPTRRKFQYMSKGHVFGVSSVMFSPAEDNESESKWLASGSDDKTVKLWLVQDNTLKFQCTLGEHGGWVNSVAFSPNSVWLASGGEDKMIKLWSVELDADGRRLQRTFEGHTHAVTSVSFSRDSQWLASSSEDWTVRQSAVGDIERELQHTFERHANTVNSVAFSPNSIWLASGSNDKTIKLWSVGPDADGCKLQRTLEGHTDSVTSVTFSPKTESVWLASGSSDRSIRLWSVRTGSSVSPDKSNWHTHAVTSVTFSRSGEWLASGSDDKTIKLWSVQGNELELKHTFTGHENPVTSVTFSPKNEELLASGSYDYTVRLWSTKTDLFALPDTSGTHRTPLTSVTFSPNGELLLSASYDGAVKLWSVEDNRLECQCVFAESPAWVSSIAFSPDGEWLAMANAIRLVYVISFASKVCFSEIGGFAGYVYSSAWRDLLDGNARLLATGGGDGVVRLWRVIMEERKGSIIIREVRLSWASHQTVLTAVDASIDNAEYLGSNNTALLIERGAKGTPKN
ncbi:HNWD1 protein [Mycoavidus cysteinexigens]|uniref:HNWD1 protein n=1 Tax=Mycoavidus cysteinexigens TaxID=1553431 RepID=A0A2Z6EST7_9BURK|nr:HNWD1 protein [Mycoavidus cysteinexigens]GAM52809.1 hypothetical protein EBME_1272 [bacterium endosymbiont of Mortierella elongata FMR23-6]GLR00981.1 hypothetical protein GCM10007934_07930 [Mycoavidus cysteinexigens]